MKMQRVLFATAGLIIFLRSPLYGAEIVTDEHFMVSSSLKMIWGLLIVLGIILISYGIARKRFRGGQFADKGIIRIIAAKYLTQKNSLYLVEVRGREFLLGSGDGRIELIAPIAGPSATFDQLLKASDQTGQTDAQA